MLEDSTSLSVVLTAKSFKNEVTRVTTLLSFRSQLLATTFCGLHSNNGLFLTPQEIKILARDVLKVIFKTYKSQAMAFSQNSYTHAILDSFTKQSYQWWCFVNVEVISGLLIFLVLY